MHGAYGRRIDGEHGRERVRILACHDLQKSAALLFAGPFIDKGQSLAISLVDSARPFENGADLEAVERGVPVPALIDLDTCDCIAVALVRKGVELAWTAIFASAVNELAAAKFPSTSCGTPEADAHCYNRHIEARERGAQTAALHPFETCLVSTRAHDRPLVPPARTRKPSLPPLER